MMSFKSIIYFTPCEFCYLLHVNRNILRLLCACTTFQHAINFFSRLLMSPVRTSQWIAKVNAVGPMSAPG